MAGEAEQAPSHHLRRKWRLVGGYWLAQTVLVAGLIPLWKVVGQNQGGVDGEELLAALIDPEMLSSSMMAGGALALLQSALIWPVRRPRARISRGVPLWLSVAVATLVGTALGVALLVVTFMAWMELARPSGFDGGGDGPMIVVLAGLVSWIVLSYTLGFILLRRFCVRRLNAGERHEDLLGRIASTLFVGTLVEAAAIMPIDVMFRRRDGCYCLAGTYLGYTVLIAAGLVTLGPAIFLPLLARRRKRWYASHCDCCGYDMSGHLAAGRCADRCPECGAGWRPEPGGAAADSLAPSAEADLVDHGHAHG